MKVVIIAAGQGSRLISQTANSPKTLLNINGNPLIYKLLKNCILPEISGVIIVTGYQHQIIEDYITNVDLDINIETIYNPNWKLENGVSILSARDAIPSGENFIVSMSDHYYGSELLEIVVKTSLDDNIATVGLDFNINNIFDIDDGMKVEVDPLDNTKISSMSKSLLKYDAIDCGVFKLDYLFFDYLSDANKIGKHRIMDACQYLITIGKMGGINIGDCFWLDIDTPESLIYLRNNYLSKIVK